MPHGVPSGLGDEGVELVGPGVLLAEDSVEDLPALAEYLLSMLPRGLTVATPAFRLTNESFSDTLGTVAAMATSGPRLIKRMTASAAARQKRWTADVQ